MVIAAENYGEAGALDDYGPRWAVPYERHVPVFLCHGPYRSVQELWPR